MAIRAQRQRGDATLSDRIQVFAQVGHWVLPGTDNLSKHCLCELKDLDSIEASHSKKCVKFLSSNHFLPDIVAELLCPSSRQLGCHSGKLARSVVRASIKRINKVLNLWEAQFRSVAKWSQLTGAN